MAPIRMSGMNSGLDTESIVKALVSNLDSKKQKVEKSQTKLEWSQEIWKGVNSKVYSLYTGLDKVRFSSAYKSKKTTVSDASKANITAGSGAVNGTQKLKITKMAAAGYLTGAKIKNIYGGTAAPESKLSSLGIESGSEIKLSYEGKDTTITVDDDMTVKDFVTKLQESGVNASFDEKNSRFFISSKESGEAHDFKLTGTGDKGVDALTKLGLFTKSDEDIAALEKTKSYGSYLSDGSLDKAATKNNLVTQLNAYRNRFEDAIGARVSATTAYDEVNSQLSEAKNNRDISRGIADYLNNKKTVLDSGLDTGDETAVAQARERIAAGEASPEYEALVAVVDYETAAADLEADDPIRAYVEQAQTALSTDLADMAGVVSDQINTYETKISGLNSLLGEKQRALNSADSNIQSIKNEMSGNELLAGYANTLSTMGAGVSDEEISSMADGAIAKIESAISGLKGEGVDGATRIKGQDAEIYLNGAQFTSDTNNFNINGLSINLTGVTGDDEITITTSTDVDAIYDKVKDFIGQYSELINELQGKYNADSAKDYEPLTEDQKAEMSDTEIEKWESKIKDSLLRRDNTLGSVISTMTSAMSMNYTVTTKDGSKQSMSLTSLGIHTMGFLNAKANEQYAYHIDGDEDDTITSGKADKLREMIESDPDAVADLMSQVAQGLYKALDTKIGAKTSEMSSAYTIYNDKQMTKQLDQYKKDIKEWDTRIADTEDMYYKRFTAMEKALANLNSTQTALSGMIG